MRDSHLARRLRQGFHNLRVELDHGPAEGAGRAATLLLTGLRAGANVAYELSAKQPSEAAPSTVESSRGADGRAPWVWAVVLVALAAGVYVGTIDNPFVFDDRVIVLSNGRDWQHDSLWQLVRHDYWGDQRLDALYRPVTTISHILNYRLSADRPRSYHVVNTVLHAACCCCLFGLSCAVFGNWRLAGAASALFAVHALHVEAVAQVVGRAELLSALWTLVALWLYVVDARRNGGRPTWRYPLALLAAALAMLSKESGMAVIGLAACYDLWALRFSHAEHLSGRSARTPTARSRRRSRPAARRWTVPRLVRLVLQRWVAMVLVSLIVLTARMQVLGELVQDLRAIDRMDNPIPHASTLGRVLTPVVLLGKYVRLLAWPDPLSHDYSYDTIALCETPLDRRLILGGLCLAAMVVGAVWSYRRRGHVLASVGFFVLTYALVSNTVVLSGTIFAERLMYLPSVAACWLFAIAAVAAAERLSALMGTARSGWWIVAPLAAALCTVHVWLTVQRGREWRSERSLAASALSVSDDSSRVHMQAGAYALEDKDFPRALHHFERAVEIMDDHMPAHLQLGRTYLLTRQPARAIPHLTRCYGRLPPELDYFAAFYLGQAHLMLRQPEQAACWFERADMLKPDDPAILSGWSRALLARGDLVRARQILKRGVEVTPASHPLSAYFRRKLAALAKTPAAMSVPR